MTCTTCRGSGIEHGIVPCQDCGGTGDEPVVDGPEDFAFDRERDRLVGL